MAEDYVLQTKITADSTQFDATLKKTGESLTTFSSEITKVTKLIGGLFVGQEIIDFGKKSVRLLEQERKETALLNKTLKITGASAWQTQDALVSMAQELERNSNYSQEQIMRAQTVMLGFKSVTGEVFDSAIQNVIDMSEVMGIDLVNSVQTIGKALDDPIKGLGSLSRQGFVFSEQQKEMLANMVAVGDKAGAQKIILEELTSTYGGAGQAGQNAFQKLNVAIGIFQKTLASNLVPTITNVAESVTGLLEDFNSLDKGTQAFILTAGGLVTTLPLIIKGVQGLKIALVSLQASVPVLLGISAGIVAISAVVGTVVKKKNEFAELSKEIKNIEETTGSYLDIYSQGNEAKLLDEEATQRLIKLYPELKGKINAYSDSVADVGNKVQELVNKKLLDAESTGIQNYIDRLNEISKLQEKANKYTSHNNEMDRARANEILTKDIPAVKELAEAQRQAINERLKGIGKMIALDGKVVDISVEVKPQIIHADTETKRRWQEVLAEVLKIDEGSFSTGKQAVGVYLNSVAQTVRQDKTISNALGEAFNIKDVLTAQQENIKQSINDILASVNVDNPFSIADFEKQNSALSQLAEKYRAISNELKGLKINDEIADLEKKVANLGKSELELYEAELKANGATEEQIKKALELKKVLLGAEKASDTVGSSWGDFVNKIKADAEDWSDVAKSLTDSLKSVAIDGIDTLGASLVDAESAWEDYGATALNMLAQVLEAIGAQLTAMATAYAIAGQYGKSAMAGAGAVALYASAGAIKATAKAMSSVEDRTRNIAGNLKDGVETLAEFQERWQALLNDERDMKTVWEQQVDLQKELTQLQKDADLYLDKANKTQYTRLVDNNWEDLYLETIGKIAEAQEKLNNLYKDYSIQLTEASDKIGALIENYRQLYTHYTQYSGVALLTQRNAILNTVAKIYEEMQEYGLRIGETLITSIIDGANYSDFKSQIKNLIRENLLKTTVYSSLTAQLSVVGSKLAKAMTDPTYQNMDDFSKDLKSLWLQAVSKVEDVEKLLDDTFGKTADELEEELSSIEQMIKDFTENISDLGGDIANSLIDGISNGLSQDDFLDNMYDYIRKLIVQTVVYTESMKSEIEAIGQAISDGISKGFTSDSLHEIRRDLSYIFDSATRQMESIDSVLDSVFKGGELTDNMIKGFGAISNMGSDVSSIEAPNIEVPEVLRLKMPDAPSLADLGPVGGGSRIFPNEPIFNVTFNNMQDTSAYAMMSQMKQWQREMAFNAVI